MLVGEGDGEDTDDDEGDFRIGIYIYNSFVRSQSYLVINSQLFLVMRVDSFVVDSIVGIIVGVVCYYRCSGLLLVLVAFLARVVVQVLRPALALVSASKMMLTPFLVP